MTLERINTKIDMDDAHEELLDEVMMLSMIILKHIYLVYYSLREEELHQAIYVDIEEMYSSFPS